MPISIQCPECLRTFRCAVMVAGCTIRCPRCRFVHQIPIDAFVEEEPSEPRTDALMQSPRDLSPSVMPTLDEVARPKPPARSRKRRWIIAVALLGLLVVAGLIAVRFLSSPATTSPPSGGVTVSNQDPPPSLDWPADPPARAIEPPSLPPLPSRMITLKLPGRVG